MPARCRDSGRGRAFVYYRHRGGSDTWGKIGELAPADLDAGDRFGSSVAVNDVAIVVGAHLTGEPTNAGSAYFFERSLAGPDGWGLASRLRAPDRMLSDRFGRAVGLQGTTVAVSAPNHDFGTVYLWDDFTPGGACCAPGGFCTETDAATCAAAGGAYGGDGSECDGVACPIEAVLLDQTANPAQALILAQNFEAVYDASDCEVADDFTVDWAGGWTVSHAAVSASNWSGWANPRSFTATIYRDNAGIPGSLVCQAAAASHLYDRSDRFLVPFPPDCDLDAGTYWLGVQGHLDFNQGLLGLHQESVQTGQPAVWRNPGDGLGTGCTGWTPGCSMSAPDLTFQILGRCRSGDCPEQAGACCFADSSCGVVTDGVCTGAGGAYLGDGSTCAEAGCAPLGACCRADGSCQELAATACVASGGTWSGDASTCGATACTFGACCLGAGFCADTTAALCVSAGGAYQGDLSLCLGVECPLDELVWDQVSTSAGVTVTQDHETDDDDLDSEGADDFEVEWSGGWEVSGVVIRSYIWGGHGVPLSMNVSILGDGGAIPGSTLCSYPNAGFLSDRSGGYLVPLDPVCPLARTSHQPPAADHDTPHPAVLFSFCPS